MSEIPLPSTLSIVMSLYGYFLPIMLYAAWSALAFFDLGRRQLSPGKTFGWVLVIFLVPFFGAMAYHLVGGSTIPKSLRGVVVGGGLACVVLVLVVGRMVGAG
jgi:Phospholipase_D-nuclease N-terminal